MAYAYGTTTVNGYWKSYLKYSTSSTATTYSVTCVVGMYNLRSYTSYDASGYLKGTGQTTYTDTSSKIGGDAGYHALISSKTYTWTKSTSSASKTITFQHKVNSGTTAPGTSTGTLSVTVPALASYTVKYNANGGSGAPSSQTKYYGKTLTLSSTKPTRAGYTFSKWNTNSSGTGTSYSAGGSYTANSAVTLYAVWTPITYYVSYNGNGSTSGSMSNSTYKYGTSYNLTANAYSKTNYSFLGWSKNSSATSATYTNKQSVSNLTSTSGATVTLYAVWKLAYTSPTISSAKCYRVASSGSTTETDDGTYIYVTFTYKGGSTDGGTTLIAPTIKITVDDASVYGPTTQSSSSGTFSAWYGPYSADNSYTVGVSVYDSTGGSSSGASKTLKVVPATYPIDLDIDGSGNVVMGVMSPAVAGQPLTLPSTVYFGDHTSAIGTAKNSYLSSAKSAASGTAVNVCTIDLEAGIWVVNCGVRFPANATGVRRANFSTTSASDGADVQWSASSAGVTQLNFTQIVGPTSTTTYYLNAYQNSGSTLSLPAGSSGSVNFIRAVRIV